MEDNDPCPLVVRLGASSAYGILQDIMPGTNGGEWVTNGQRMLQSPAPRAEV